MLENNESEKKKLVDVFVLSMWYTVVRLTVVRLIDSQDLHLKDSDLKRSTSLPNEIIVLSFWTLLWEDVMIRFKALETFVKLQHRADLKRFNCRWGLA